ncbi:MAG TPA: carbohydrate binding domain-containing protein, partial [Polyangia bacterium]|nr:carbohydrate binding domain-containing protein [Polyangia bacterium]
MALALAAALGLGTVAAGCGNQTDGTSEAVSSEGQGAMIDAFESAGAGWTPFMTAGSTLSETSEALHADGASTSTEIAYSVAAGGSAGLQRAFSTPQDWSAKSGLTVWVYGRATGHSFLVQVSDAGNERWEARFTVDFSGWKQVSIPFASLTAAAWQPPDARVDGVRDFGGVTGMALAPSERAGAGVVNLDLLALGGAAPDGGAAPT